MNYIYNLLLCLGLILNFLIPKIFAYDDLINHVNNIEEFCSEYSYCFRPPMVADMVIGENNVPAFVDNFYSGKSNYGIQPYHSPQFTCNSTTNCPDIGVSEYSTNTVNDGDIYKWGKLDYFNTYAPHGDFPQDFNADLCRPATATGAAYILYSENKDKSVVICISQATDDPQMAKEVFESFRWLDESDIFTDVPLTHPNATAIAYVKDQGIVQGYPSTSSRQALFKPEATINRAEFTKILISASSDGSTPLAMTDECTNKPSFADVEPKSWYESYVKAAQCRGIISGYPATSSGQALFKPANSINAAEAAKIIVNAFSLPLATVEVDAAWYQGYWSTLETLNAIPSSVTMPSHEITRGEMAEIIYKVMTRGK